VELGTLLTLEDAVLPGDIEIKEHVDRELIRIQEKVLFEKNSHALKKSSFGFLNKMGQIIKRGEYPIDIIVHTDNRPGPEKGYRSNWDLAGLRVMAVARYLVEKSRISADRLTPCGRGAQDPIASNQTRRSRELNRRIEVVLYSGAQPHARRIFGKKPGGIFTYKRFNFKLF
jgi:chemotaxis protein MotB